MNFLLELLSVEAQSTIIVPKYTKHKGYTIFVPKIPPPDKTRLGNFFETKFGIAKFIMADLLIGDSGCRVLDVVTIMNQQDESGLVKRKTEQFWRKLEFRSTTTKQSAPNFNLNQLEPYGSQKTMKILLSEWISRAGTKAELSTLLDALHEIGMNKTAMVLKTHFANAKNENASSLQRKCDTRGLTELSSSRSLNEYSTLQDKSDEITDDQSTRMVTQPKSDHEFKNEESDLEFSPLIMSNEAFSFAENIKRSADIQQISTHKCVDTCIKARNNEVGSYGAVQWDVSSTKDDIYQSLSTTKTVLRNWRVVNLANCMMNVVSISLYLSIFLTSNGAFRELLEIPKEVRILGYEIASMKYKVLAQGACTSTAKTTQMLEISVCSYMEYQHKVYDEEHGNFDLSINLTEKNTWLPNMSMDKSERITKLRLTGQLTTDLVHGILREAKSTEILHVVNSHESLCFVSRNASDVMTYKNIELHNLTELRLKKFSSCNNFFELLCSKLYTGKLSSLHFIEGEVSNETLYHVHKFLTRNLNSLEKLYFPLVTWNNTRFGQYDTILEYVTQIQMDFLPEKNAEGSYISEKICKMFPHLTTFTSTNGHLPLQELKYFFECSILSNLTLKAVVPKNIDSVDILSLVGPAVRTLKFIDLQFWFMNDSCSIVGADELSKKIAKLTIRSNCKERESINVSRRIY